MNDGTEEKIYIKEPMRPDDLIEAGNKTIIDLAMEATKEALKEGIKANSIIINQNMCKVSETWFRDGFGGAQCIPPMICGLHAYFTKDELPDGYSFAVLEGPEHEDRLKQFESIGMEPDELRKAAELYRCIQERMV